MNIRKPGKHYPLLLYHRTMDRVWKSTLALAIVLGGAGFFTLTRPTQILGFHSDIWLIATAILALGITFFAFFARFLAYIQPTPNSIKIVTPFLRFQVSFRRMRSVRPLLVQQIFPKNAASWAQQSYLEPFYGKTALVVDLKGYPLKPVLLRLFLPREMFSPQSTGLVLVVPDWMEFSTELDSYHGAWMQRQSQRLKGRG